MKKIIGLIIVTSIFVAYCIPVFAVTDEMSVEEVSPMYINIMSLAASLDINILGVAACGANMTQSLHDGSCELIMNLQKLDSNENWNTIATWTKEGKTKCANSQYKAVSKGIFRLSVIGKVYDSNGDFIESGTAKSMTVTY